MDGLTYSSSVATSSQRPRDFRVCVNDNSGTNIGANTEADVRRHPWGVAPIHFRYSIESLFSPTLLSVMEKDSILKSVSAAIIESIYEIGCLPQNRKRRRQNAVSFSSSTRSRRAEILSISPGTGHEWLGPCDDLLPSDNIPNTIVTYCSMILGTLVIGFDENIHLNSNTSNVTANDFNSVGNVVLSKIEQDMINGNYIEIVNDDIASLGVTISYMTFIGSDYPDLVNENVFGSMNANPQLLEAGSVPLKLAEMTRFSKVVIPIMAILFLLAMAFCWCAIMSWPKDVFPQKNRRKKSENEDFHGNHSQNHLQPNVRRDADDIDPIPSSMTRYGNAGELSLAATLQDLSHAEALKYGDQKTTQPSSSGNPENYSSIPRRNTKLSRDTNQFLPVTARDRPQNTMYVVDGTYHPSDTETGSSGRSVDFRNDIGDFFPNERKADLENAVNHGKVPDDHSFAKKGGRNATPIRFLSSFLGGNNASEATSTATNTNNLMDRISSCTSIQNNKCLGGAHELLPDVSKKQNDENKFRYVIPTVDRSNSLVETESLKRLPSSEEIPNRTRSTLSRMGTKKSAAYREYINDKILRREAECEQLESSIPIEIGVKRTFTDAQGRIREMVAL